MAAALLVLLLLLAVPLTAFPTTDVYYVTADDAEQSCPPHQICHNLSYYISQPDHYFTSDTTIIFLEGEHSFDREDLVHVNNVHNLTLKGQGQWPVAGAEETVMQSTAIINCTRRRVELYDFGYNITKGGFYFNSSHNITVQGLTVVNCGEVHNNDGEPDNKAVMYFDTVVNLFFLRNSIQHITGYGLLVHNCDNVIISNCSYYHTIFLCGPYPDQILFCNPMPLDGGVAIVYDTQNTGYTLELSHSNITNCGSSLQSGRGISLQAKSRFGSASVHLSHLVFSHTIYTEIRNMLTGAGLCAVMIDEGYVSLTVSNCVFFHYGCVDSDADETDNNYGEDTGGMYFFVDTTRVVITIQNTHLVENKGYEASEIYFQSFNSHDSSLSILNSTITHTETPSTYAVSIKGCCTRVIFRNTRMRVTKQIASGVFVDGHFQHFGTSFYYQSLKMDNCIIERSQSGTAILLVSSIAYLINNCTFSNNSGSQSVIMIHKNDDSFGGCQWNIYSQVVFESCSIISNCLISDNNMTGIAILKNTQGLFFQGRNVIQNNRNTQGAGIVLMNNIYIDVTGELLLYNNTADKHGGAILVIHPLLNTQLPSSYCTMSLHCGSVIFSGNRAGQGGSDMYGAILMGCDGGIGWGYVSHAGHPNEISWYFDTNLMKNLHFSNTDRLSSMSSDPIMVCFCNTTTNLPDCSDRTHHIQTYPGLEINTSIATVGYYGGTSPGVVKVTAQHARLVRYYGQNETTQCFQLHILLQNTSSTTALVDIRVDGRLPNLSLGVSIGVDILECPIGFTDIKGQCQCEQFLDTSHVQCNLSATPFKFMRSGNGWFGYINNTQCITGTTNCPFAYCNRSDISFDIMTPDRQCVANRTGILCGLCQPHLSIMLGSNHCGTCSNWYLFQLPVFAIAGIVLVAVLMFLNLSVSVGTINGLLFYANMVKLNEAFFFPNGGIPVVSQFISWLNLDLGIEVCLFDGLDGYWNTWLQFVFPAYLFLLMGGIIVGCRYSVWLCRLCGSHAVPALATLFLMSYTKILLTVTNALSMSHLPCNDGIMTVWSVDGNIEYGSSEHLILVVVSCGVLVIGLAYPVLVLCAPLLERYSQKCIPQHWWNPVAKFKPLFDAYGGPYKDKYRFWTGVTLMVRLTLTVTFSFTSGELAAVNACIIISCVVGILTFWFFTKGVYTKSYLSALEVFYLLNIFLLSTVSLATASLGSANYQTATIVSVCLSFVVCLVTMAMHLWWNFDLKKIKRRLGFRDRPEYANVAQVAEDEYDEEDRHPPGSPPSIVYGSHRGEHQFVLEFPYPHDENESSSPVLLAREPLLFDT